MQPKRGPPQVEDHIVAFTLFPGVSVHFAHGAEEVASFAEVVSQPRGGGGAV